jgi:hypothetical protein
LKQEYLSFGHLDVTLTLKINRNLPVTATNVNYDETKSLKMNYLPDCLASRKLMPTKDKT